MCSPYFYVGRVPPSLIRKMWRLPSDPAIWDRDVTGRCAVVPGRGFRRFLRALGVHRPGARVLVPASYSGEYYKAVRRLQRATVALDISKTQLGRYGGARVLADMRKMPFRDDAFTHVITFEPTPLLVYTDGVGGALEALREMVRVTRPGGVLAIFHRHEMDGIRALATFLREIGVPVHSLDVSDIMSDRAAVTLVFLNEYAKRRALRDINKLLKLEKAEKWEEIAKHRGIGAILRNLTSLDLFRRLER